jgi:hypothetical protein
MQRTPEGKRLLGPEGLLGQRHFSRREYEYLKQKKDLITDARIMSVAESAYDPVDPYQRQELDRLLPGLKNSKLDVLNACVDQHKALISMSIRGRFQNFEELSFAIRVLGGIEPIMLHPLSVDLFSAMVGRGEGGLGDIIRGALAGDTDNYFGVFTFNDRQATKYADDTGMAASRPAREELARQWMPLFPAFATGRYIIGGAKTSSQDAETLVNACEEASKTMTSFGHFTKDILLKALSEGQPS